jgi:hypothetical protein
MPGFDLAASESLSASASSRSTAHSLPQTSRPSRWGKFERIFEFKSSTGNMYSSDNRDREADDEQHG